MIRREPTKRGDKVHVTFELPDDGGDSEIFLVGDFNGWSESETPLRRKDGVRKASLTLVADRRYAFRYLRDGKWFNDETADGYEPNDYGETNSVLELGS